MQLTLSFHFPQLVECNMHPFILTFPIYWYIEIDCQTIWFKCHNIPAPLNPLIIMEGLDLMYSQAFIMPHSSKWLHNTHAKIHWLSYTVCLLSYCLRTSVEYLSWKLLHRLSFAVSLMLTSRGWSRPVQWDGTKQGGCCNHQASSECLMCIDLWTCQI